MLSAKARSSALLARHPFWVTGEILHIDAGYHVVGMKNEDAPDISVVKE